MAGSLYQDLVTWTLDNAEISEDRLIYVDAANPERRLLKSQCRRLIRQLIAGLRHENGGDYFSGDVVCLHAFNDIYYPAVSLAVIGAGGCWTGTNPAYTASELSHHFKTSNTKLIITEPEHLSQVLIAANACNIPGLRVFTFSPSENNSSSNIAHHPSGCRDWSALLQHGESDWLRFDDAAKSRSVSIGLFSTSGTTGLPKMAARTHLSFVTESFAIRDRQIKPYKETRLLCVPFFHAFAAPLGLVDALRNGATTYVMRRYHHAGFLTAIKQFDITETAMVPPVIMKFLSSPPEEQHVLRNLQLVWCGGAPLDASTQARGVSLLAPDGRIVQVWGMTEAGWITTFPYPERDLSGSVGRLLPTYQAKLLNHDGSDVTDPNGCGEIVVKGPMLMQCYYGNAAATEASYTSDGWFRTGDIARLDGDIVHIVDRKKELIKVRGWQVAPAELESILLKHPAILDSAVIGVDAPDGTTEVPRAYVVRRSGSIISEAVVKAFLLEHLARYKVGDCQVRFCEAIPRSPSGKILRKIFRAESEKESSELPAGKGTLDNNYSNSDNNKKSSSVYTYVKDHALLKTLGIPVLAILCSGLYRPVVDRVWGVMAHKGGLLQEQIAWLYVRMQGSVAP